jgi:hypothetical protein
VEFMHMVSSRWPILQFIDQEQVRRMEDPKHPMHIDSTDPYANKDDCEEAPHPTMDEF